MPILEVNQAAEKQSLSVHRFSVQESISFGFSIHTWARSDNPSLDLSSVIGHPASFLVDQGHAFAHLHGPRLWNGIVSYAEQVHAEASAPGLSSYYFRIVPTLWLLTERRNYRIFQHLSIPDIAGLLLGEWDIHPAWHIDRLAYPALEYKVQYGETDHDFLSRILEEAGIAFTFRHPDDGTTSTKLILSDALHRAPPREAPPIRYVDSPNTPVEHDFITGVCISQEVRPGTHTVRDYDFRNPAFPLFSASEHAVGHEARYEQYHYEPGAFLIETRQAGTSLAEPVPRSATPVADDPGAARHDQRFGRHLAERALLGERMGRQGISFETNAFDLCPGTVFSMDGHPHTELHARRKLLVTEVSLDGSLDGEWTMSAAAVFTDTPYRPPLRTPKPEVFGFQSATVVGPKGQEIHTDEFGRVRVKFHWDREEQLNEQSSCWIRVSQGWSGAGYGFMALPRIGQEVLVSFLEGDPDQPVLAGRLFNATQPVPHGLPLNKTVSTWKSDSSQGSKGFNEIKLEDKLSDELLYIQAQRNLRKLVNHDETTTILRDREMRVTVNETRTTGSHRTEVTGASRMEITDASRITFVGGNRAKMVKRNEIEQIEGSRRRRVGTALDAVVKGRKRERVEADVHLHEKGRRSEQIDRKDSLTVGGDLHEQIGGTYALAAGKQIHLAADDAVVGEADRDVTIKGPGGFIRIDAAGVTIKGTIVDINVHGEPGTGKGAKPGAPANAVAVWIEAPDAATAGLTGQCDGQATTVSDSPSGSKFWKKVAEFQGTKVFQRDDLINPKRKDKLGRTNLERMKQGLAPLGPDRRSINLHHLTQNRSGSIAELTHTFHKKHHRIIHINPRTIPSGIDRKAFNRWKQAYWKNRARDFEAQGASS
ncbi:type VI secretion system tip protein TssI/VgrG [Sorangium sp. So ce291]|uniref:type VI secretion system tip protein TssI/VgrG n=1 Tax=Sorangium sp. So ce291 TaxID=3133294 RepID=UPI003F63BA0F